MIVERNELGLISFPDFNVIFYKVNIKAKQIIIKTDGAYLDMHGGQVFGHAEIIFEKWESFQLQLYDSEWQLCGIEFDKLKDICEFESQGQVVCLRGFGCDVGYWLEMKIVGGLAMINLE
jgi:hypothetical protein